MKKKIDRQLTIVMIWAVVATVVLMVAIFYSLYKKQVVEDLRTFTEILAEMEFYDLAEENKVSLGGETSLRVTLIDKNGVVRFDNTVDIDELDNHSDRPEFKEALKSGEGYEIRQSATVKQNTYYFALLMENGDVLRVAKQAHSIWQIFYTSVPVVIILISVLIMFCARMSRYFTKSLLRPIEEMGKHLDDYNEIETYPELVPFVRTIKEQHEAILENANIRQEFSANVSHELKTPLTAISGYSELIESGIASGEDIKRFAAGIHQSANRLLTLIDDTIRLSELDGGSLLSLEPLHLDEIAKTSVDMLQIHAENHKVTLTYEGNSCEILGDKQMMEELIYNLCDNAIRYNNAGGHVWVYTGVQNKRPVLQVKDTGIGIPKEHQSRIFERFYRVDKSRSKSTGGTGLGLAIVKHIVVSHDAMLELDSDYGKGTTVTITFPERND